MEYILSYKMSQDHLVTYFSAMRSKVGYNNNNPSIRVQNFYKKLLVHHHVNGSQYGRMVIYSRNLCLKQNKLLYLSDSIIQDTYQ
jgi:DNA transposase THAP9